MGGKELKPNPNAVNGVPKQVQAPKQKGVDEVFLRLIDESIEKDKALLKKLAKA